MQKVLLSTFPVLRTQCNVLSVRRVLHDVQSALEEGRYSNVGSTILWEHHLAMIEHMDNKLIHLQINQNEVVSLLIFFLFFSYCNI